MSFIVEMRYRCTTDENVEKKLSSGSSVCSLKLLHLKSFSVCRAAYCGAPVTESSVKMVMWLVVI
jgi:hypothetical protein